MAAARLDFIIEQGATFKKKLTLKDSDSNPIDLTGFTFRGKIKKLAGKGVAIASFTFTILDQGTNTGEVYLALTAAETAALPSEPQINAQRTLTEYAYDIESVAPSTEVSRIIEGTIKLSPEVTD